MVSKEYLSLLDEILQQSYENTKRYPVSVYLAELKYDWGYLKTKYPIYKLGFDTYLNSIVDVLIGIAFTSYELLSALTDSDMEQIISAAKTLHEEKNKGYSGTELTDVEMTEIYGDLHNTNIDYVKNDSWRNFRTCQQFGIPVTDGCMTRICDKYNRFFSVYTNPDNDKVSESAVDTLRDLASYALILVCLIKEND